MPRNSPSTEPEPNAAVIELDLLKTSGSPATPPPHSAGGRGRWLVWVALAVAVALGLAVLPGVEGETGVDATLQSLADPVIATTSSTVSAPLVGVMSDETFALTPVRDLDGFVQLTGPVEFDGKHWIAGNYAYPSAEVTILSSVDGSSWGVEATVSAGEGEWLRIDDLGSFGGVLMAVGVVAPGDGPAYAAATANSMILWRSGDGVRWSPLPIFGEEGRDYSNLRLTSGSGAVLITGYQVPAFDASLLEKIPSELIPGLERGDFQWWHDSSLRVVAPPGIELFSTPMEQPPNATGSFLTLRSDNLLVWEQLSVNVSKWMAPTTFDDGFVASGSDGEVLHSTDGRTWEPTGRFPPVPYQGWGDRLVGLDYSSAISRLIVIDDQRASIINFPSEITDNQYGTNVTGGPSGLAMVGARYDERYVEPVAPIARIDGLILTVDGGDLRIEDPSGASDVLPFQWNGFIRGTYVPETDSVRLETTDGSRTFEFPVAGLLDLRGQSQQGRFEVFLSDDGLSWAHAQTGLRADWVDILGSTRQSFLVALHRYDPNYRPQPITVYRTGPVD